jgi:hypothetical protein
MLTGEGSRAHPSVIASNETTGQLGARSSWTTIFLSFLRLGCTSFGGPIAHLGYFRNESSFAANGWTRRHTPTL